MKETKKTGPNLGFVSCKEAARPWVHKHPVSVVVGSGLDDTDVVVHKLGAELSRCTEIKQHHLRHKTGQNLCINRTLEMMSDVPTNAGKQVTSYSASAQSQRNTNNSVFWLAQKTLFVISRIPPNINVQCRWSNKWFVDTSINRNQTFFYGGLKSKMFRPDVEQICWFVFFPKHSEYCGKTCNHTYLVHNNPLPYDDNVSKDDSKQPIGLESWLVNKWNIIPRARCKTIVTTCTLFNITNYNCSATVLHCTFSVAGL